VLRLDRNALGIETGVMEIDLESPPAPGMRALSDVLLSAGASGLTRTYKPETIARRRSGLRQESLEEYWTVSFSSRADVLALSERLEGLPAVVESIPLSTGSFDYYLSPEDYYWYLDNDNVHLWVLSQTSGYDIDADIVWDSYNGDGNQLIGILDSGVQGR
jgi:hypothetical protein